MAPSPEKRPLVYRISPKDKPSNPMARLSIHHRHLGIALSALCDEFHCIVR